MKIALNRNRHKKAKASPAVRALCVGGAVALGSAALCCAYVELMTSVVARRRNPALARFVEVCTTPPAERDHGKLSEAAIAAKELTTLPVSLVNSEGLTLRARYYPTKDPKRLLILFHGLHSAWYRDFGAAIPFFHESGCDLLMVEQRCHGESEGKYISYGIKERHDVLTWLDWAEKHLPPLPIYLGGLSMGAATVLMSTGLPLAGRVRGVIADCGYTTPHDIIHMTMKKTLRVATAPTMLGVELNCRIKGNWRMKEYSTLDAMRENTSVPVLFIHGDADKLVPCEMSLENFEACRAPKEIFIVPHAGHGLAYATDPEGYSARVLSFFAKHDPKVSEVQS